MFIEDKKTIIQDNSDIYSHASKIMFDKYRDTAFKRTDP